MRREAGLLALEALMQGRGYEGTSMDVLMAHDATMNAAARLGQQRSMILRDAPIRTGSARRACPASPGRSGDAIALIQRRVDQYVVLDIMTK